MPHSMCVKPYTVLCSNGIYVFGVRKIGSEVCQPGQALNGTDKRSTSS